MNGIEHLALKFNQTSKRSTTYATCICMMYGEGGKKKIETCF